MKRITGAVVKTRHAALFLGAIAGSLACLGSWAAGAADAAPTQSPAATTQSATEGGPNEAPVPAAIAPAKSNVALSTQTAADWHNRHALYFKRNWGIDIVGVHPVSSGYMLTFRYRVLDAEKAKIFGEKKTKPFLIDQATGISLAVPAMENVGELRQASTLEEGREYFMVFGNPGKIVKPGSVVTVVVGKFRVEGLVVN